MGKGLILKNTAKVGGGSILRILMYLRFLFIGVWMALLFTVPLIDSVEQEDPNIFLKEVGGRLVLATTNLNDELSKINEQGFITDPTAFEEQEGGGLERFIGKIKQWFSSVGTIYLSIYTLWLWIRLFVWIISRFNDTSRVFVNYSFALVIVFLLQISTIFAFGDGNWTVVFSVWKELYGFLVLSLPGVRTSFA